MVLQLQTPLEQRLRQWAEQGYPFECCGLLLGRAHGGVVQVEDVMAARNLDTERANDRYELDPRDLLRADDEARARQLEIVGIWHTHPDHPAQPSSTDREHAWEGWSYLILSVDARGVQAVRSWRLNGQYFVEEAVQ
jgi:proteasome lid subunit RPN8/RPN11